MMPGFDGVETLKYIREMDNGVYKELPIVALTANTISGAREMFKHEGFTEFIPKPIERSVLERVLRRVLPEQCIQYEMEPVLSNVLEEESVSSSVLEEEIYISHTDTTETGEESFEADEDVSEESDRFSALWEAGINVKMGLDYCCGEEEFYDEMLQMFSSQYEEKKNEIIAFYDADNWADYAVKVHALKSTSLTIGAEELSAYAKELELAGKRGDVDYIREHHLTLLRMYEEVCERIAEIQEEI